MQKSFILLPLVAFALAGCTNNNATDTAAAEVSNVGAPAWQTDVQPAPMPSSMGQPTYQPQNMPQPITTAPAAPSYGQSEMVGGCNVMRDGNNAPIYAQIQKGCYTDSSYTVGKHDTVFLIAYLSGKSVADIARLNHLSQPYQLKMGQVLRLR